MTDADAPLRAQGWALALGGGIVVLLAAGLAFEPRIADLPVPSFVARFNPLRLAAGLGFGLTGAAVVAARPGHRVGWLMVLLGGAQALSLFLEGYGVVAVHDRGAGLAGGDWAIALGTAVWAAPYFAVPALLLLLVPDGGLPGRRWAPAAWLAVGAGVLSGIGWFLLPPERSDVALRPPGHDPSSPTWEHADVLTGIGGVAAVAALVAGVVAIALRYRGADRRGRGQLTWILLGGVATLLLAVAGFALGADGAWVAAAAVLPLPAAVAVAVGRFGLWDNDGLLRRVLAGSVLAAGVLACFLLVVTALGSVLGERTGAPLVATTAVAVLILPAHRWAVRWANRVVYGAPETPAEQLDRLARDRMVAAREDERARLQRDLHDGLGPTLAALALELDRGRMLLPTDPAAAGEVLDVLADRLRETVATVRGLVDDLRPPPLDELGLAGALEATARRFRAAETRFEVVVDDDLPALPADLELACFRIAAEAMTNVVRHARAERARVAVTAHDGNLEVVVGDDGVGLPDPAATGTGTRSMRERAAHLGGTLTIETSGTGTVVRAMLPLAGGREAG